MDGLVAITYRCNAKCHMCNTWQHPSDRQEELQPRHLDTLPTGLRFANITGGEPFTRDDIEEFVKVLATKTSRVVISTNGYFTDRVVRLAEKHPRVGVRVSLEGLPKANDELRGLDDGFDRGLRTLLRLHRMGLKDIGFGITLSDRNVMDMMELYEMAKMMNLEFATAAVHNTYYFHKSDNHMAKADQIGEQLDRLAEDLLRSKRVKNWFRAYFNYALKNYVKGGKRLLPCRAGTNLFFVDPFGQLRPCNGMEESLGSLKDSPFDDLWNGDAAKRIRNRVDTCDMNCCMIGSVAPVMKEKLAIPAKWVLRQKLRMLMGKKPCLNGTANA